MEIVTRFKANDGSEWNTETECRAQDAMIVEVAAALAQLKPTPTDCNWDGYVQQNSAAVTRCKEMLYKIANRDGVLKWWLDSQKKNHNKTDADLIRCHPSYFGRMLDGGHAPLSKAYIRLCCIDDAQREWNQPFYAINPDKGVMKCVG